VVEVT